MMNITYKVLDHGSIQLIDCWGTDERIVESARMSTNKAFQGWGSPNGKAGDERLLAYLYEHKHMTPFEMCGFTIEVKAPIFVFREWHRHRTQSYNEMSARYIPLPYENYVPSQDRIRKGAQAGANRQAAGTQPLLTEAIGDWLKALEAAYEAVENTYQTGLAIGIPKELARLCLPVGRYSKMRASANLRNWLAFLTLRMDENAQWEIRQYAKIVATIVQVAFPRTFALFAANSDFKGQ